MRSKKRTRTTEITIEKREVFVIRKSKKVVYDWCAECKRRVEMMTPEEAAVSADVSARTIYRWVDSGRIHFADNERSLLVCRNSLGLLIV